MCVLCCYLVVQVTYVCFNTSLLLPPLLLLLFQPLLFFYSSTSLLLLSSSTSPSLPPLLTNTQYVDREKAAASLKIGDIVERHMMDNDVVLFNRQVCVDIPLFPAVVVAAVVAAAVTAAVEVLQRV
jgi:hypothetical protein